MTPRFALVCNVPELAEVPILEGQTTIGRHPDNRIPIDDDRASRFHCSVEADRHGRLVLRDLGSRNGTKLNEKKVAEAEVRAGDVIRVGRHVFRVREVSVPVEQVVEPDDIPLTPDDLDAGGEPSNDSTATALARRARKSRPKPIPFDPNPRAKLRKEKPRAWVGELDAKVDALGDTQSTILPVLIDTDGKASSALDAEADGPMLLRRLLQLAGAARATDIHIEPKDGHSSIRMRVDGSMVPIIDIDHETAQNAVRVVKTACQIREGGRDHIADGHFSLMVTPHRIDYRASLTPTVHGQKLVLRVLDPRTVPRSLESLQFPPYIYERVRKVCEQNTGLLLVCGPTGSGKTTTLYNALRTINRDTRNVITIEDPVEYSIEGVTQIPVSDKSDFHSLLRSVLRQDPDVILVGEVRDLETARTAMQAAMTGHVVFSTLHARDTIGSVFRLIDLGVENYLVANSLDVVIAQRLVRVLCDNCKRSVRVSPGQATRIGKFLEGATETYSATGCAACLRTGYLGRRAIFEMLDFSGNDQLRDLVLQSPSIQKIRKTIEQGVFSTLQQAGWRLAARGITSLDEIEQVTGNG